MTQEDKELLLKDLSERLPYGVMLKTDNVFPQKLEGISFDKDTFLVWVSDGGFKLENMECKPYLFPLSNMTNEQREELKNELIGNDEYATHLYCVEFVNFLKKHHFDIYGLIPMGLAIDATGKNIY